MVYIRAIYGHKLVDDFALLGLCKESRNALISDPTYRPHISELLSIYIVVAVFSRRTRFAESCLSAARPA